MNLLLQYISKKAIGLYLILLAIVSIIAMSNSLPFLWIFFGTIEVVLFFYLLKQIIIKWLSVPLPYFKKLIFRNAFIIRVIYVIFSYFFYTSITGQPFEFETADAMGYHESAIWYLKIISYSNIAVMFKTIGTVYSDMGYPLYLTVIYSIFGSSVFIVRIFKALISAYTCILIYKLAQRNFGDDTARIAAIIAMLLPNLIYYCGLHVKETEMVFLVVLFAERADLLIRSKVFSFKKFIIPLLVAVSLFFFRTVLGIALLLSLLAALLFTSTRIINNSYRIGILSIAILAIILVLNSKLESEVTRYWGERFTNQEAALQDHSKQEGGNKFIKYGKTSIFAPLMLIAPFPTLVNIETQQNQMYINGAYYIRNIYAFFVLIALISLWKLRKYKEHILLLAITFFYLGILTFSKFALSERFHMPIVPFLIIIAAYGITKTTNKEIKYFNWYLALVAILIIGWNWFKLAGRGII